MVVDEAEFSKESEASTEHREDTDLTSPPPDASPPPSLPSGGGMKKKANVKSKTWFPGVRDTRANVSGNRVRARPAVPPFASPTHSSHSEGDSSATALRSGH